MGNGYRTDTNVNMSDKEATVFNSLPPWFGCFCYLLVGLSVSLVYVLSEVDYLMLSGVFRAQRFFSDDPFYFSKQVLIVYGFVGFLVTILVGPIGRLPCVLWSWALSCAYFCLSFYVFLYSFSQYGRFMMFALALLSLLSHVLLANFVFFLFDGGAYDFRLPRCFAFLIGFFAGSPLVSFVLFRLKLCFTSSLTYDFRFKTFDVFRLLTTLFSLAMLSSVCLTYELHGYSSTLIDWAPAKRVRAPVRAIAQFVDGEVIVLLFLLCPMWVDLGQYAAKSHGDWVEARLGHKAMFAVALILLLFFIFSDYKQLCVTTINEINSDFKLMFTDGYKPLTDGTKQEPVSITSIPNYKLDCKSGKKINNTLSIPGPVTYPYLPDYSDDAENEDKLMLATCLKMLNGLDSISHYLASGSSADLCKLSNELNLQDCWLESQDPLALIDHILNEYINTLSYMLGNCLNLNETTSYSPGFNFHYLRYLHCFYPCHTTKFSPLFDHIKCFLSYMKNYKDYFNCFKRYVCCYLCLFRRLKNVIECALELITLIESIVLCIETQIKYILDDFNVLVLTDVVLEHYRTACLAVKQEVEIQKSVKFSKQNLSQIKSALCKNNVECVITYLNTIVKNLTDINQRVPFDYSLWHNVGTICKTLCSICTLNSYFVDFTCRLQTQWKLISKVSVNFSSKVKVNVTVPFDVRLKLKVYIQTSLQNRKKCMLMQLRTVNCKINELRQKICEIIDLNCKVKRFFNGISCWKSRFNLINCLLRKLGTEKDFPIVAFLCYSVNANITKIKQLFKISPRGTSPNDPFVLRQLVIGLRSHINDLTWLLFSRLTIVETKLVVYHLYNYDKNMDCIFAVFFYCFLCPCVDRYIEFKPDCINFRDLMFKLYSDVKTLDHNHAGCDEIEDKGGHLCACALLACNLYPKLMNCYYLFIDADVNVLNGMLRKYNSNGLRTPQTSGILQITTLLLDLLTKITNRLNKKHTAGREQKFLCSDHTDCDYMYFFFVIKYICYLIENFPSIDNTRIQETTQRLSILSYCLDLHNSCDNCGSAYNKRSQTNGYTVFAHSVEIYCLHLLNINSNNVKINFLTNVQLMALNQGTQLVFTVLDSMLTIHVSLGYINLVYHKISSMSFYLIHNNKNHVIAGTNFKNSLTIVTSKYISCLINPNSLCKCEVKQQNVCKCCRTVAKSLTLANAHLKLIMYQISNNSMIEMMTFSIEDNKDVMEYIFDANSNGSENLLKKSRHTRILDATCSLDNISNTHMTDLNPKYYVSDKVFRPSACIGFGYFKFVITRFFLVVFLVLMFWFLRFRFDPFVPGAFSQLRNYDYAATSAHLTSLIAKSQNAVNSQSLSDVADTSGVRDAANVGIAKPRLKKAKHFVLIGAFAAVSAVYITLVIRDIYVAVTLDCTTLSYLINVAIVCGMFMTLFIKYFIHLYDFMQVLQRYGVKLTRASTFLDTAARGGSHAVMLLSLVKTMGADLTSLALLKRPTPSSSSYSDMKNALYPYNTMTAPIRRMTTADSDHFKELENLRASVLASLGDAKKIDDRTNRTGKKADKSTDKSATNTLDLHSVLDFVSYVLMSKTSAFQYHTFSADDAYLSWRLGRPINHNFFLLAYARYTAVYELYARTQAFNFGQFYTAEQNCNLLWRAFGDAQIDAITLKCMAEDSLSTPMTQLQTQMLKAKIAEEYLHSFIGFQTFVASTVFGVKDKSAGSPTDSLFPFVAAFNKLELDSELVTRLATKFFGDTQRKVSAGVAVPSSTCALDGDAKRVRDRLKDSCAEWLDKKRHCCESLAGAGCDCIVHRAHDLVLKAIAEPGDVRDNVVTLVETLNLEDVEVLDKTFETDVGAKRALKDYSATLLEHRQLDAVSADYESTVAHYLKQFLFVSYENRDRAAVPLGLYMQWHGAPLCDPHLRNVDKFDHFRK